VHSYNKPRGGKLLPGDTHVGGEDVENRMVQHWVDELNVNINKILVNQIVHYVRVRTACERGKTYIIIIYTASMEIDSYMKVVSLIVLLHRGTIWRPCVWSIVRKCMEPVEKVCKDAKMAKSDVDDVVLVGGVHDTKDTRDDKNFLNGKEPCKSIIQMEAVAYGAAVHAAILTGQGSDAN